MNGNAVSAAVTPAITAADLPTLRAAYSDRTAALMAHLAALAYDFPPATCAPGLASTLPDTFEALGFTRITYFHNGRVDGWAFVVEGPSINVVAFRGTRSPRNWRTNFQVRLTHPPNTDPNLYVHAGFLAAFEDLNDGSDGIGATIARIAQISASGNAKDTAGRIPLYFTGHSLGGALAQIAAAVYGSDQVAACYTFGSPRVGNATFDLWVKPPSYRIINYADLVPQIPLFGPEIPLRLYRHSGDPRYLPDHTTGSLYRYEPGWPTRVLQLAKGALQFLKTRSILGIADHAVAEYEGKLAEIATSRTQQTDPAVPTSSSGGPADHS